VPTIFINSLEGRLFISHLLIYPASVFEARIPD